MELYPAGTKLESIFRHDSEADSRPYRQVYEVTVSKMYGEEPYIELKTVSSERLPVDYAGEFYRMRKL